MVENAIFSWYYKLIIKVTILMRCISYLKYKKMYILRIKIYSYFQNKEVIILRINLKNKVYYYLPVMYCIFLLINLVEIYVFYTEVSRVHCIYIMLHSKFMHIMIFFSFYL